MKYLKKFETCDDLTVEVLNDTLQSENVNLLDHDIIFNAKPQESWDVPEEYSITNNDSDGYITGASLTAFNALMRDMLALLDSGYLAKIKVNDGDWFLINNYSESGGTDNHWWYFKNNNDTIAVRHYWDSSNFDHENLKVNDQYLNGTYYLQCIGFKCFPNEISKK